MKTVNAVFFSIVCLSAFGQGTIVAPNGLENTEGDTSAIPFLGGIPARTQVIYGAGNFGLFPTEGAYLTELRFRVDGQSGEPFTGTAELEVRMSTSGVNPNFLNPVFARNTGSDETIVVPRQTISLASGPAVPGGPNSFSVVIPLPNRFYYNAQNGALLLDVFVYNGLGLRNLDWDSNQSDSVSTAVGGLTASTAAVVTSTSPVAQFVFAPVPEPASFLTFVLGLVAMFHLKRRRYVAP